MRIVIEIGGWEHDCCGVAFERDSVVTVSCLRLGSEPASNRLVESHHDLGGSRTSVALRGRVADIAVLHPDGVVEQIHRLPGGRALRGFDDGDDGHLEQPWNGQPVVADSDCFLLTLIT